MKKIIFTLISFLLLTACSSDDDANSSSSESNLKTELLGTWKYESVTFDGTTIELEEGHCVLDNKITYLENNELIYDVVNYSNEECTYYDAIEEFWFVEDESTYLSVQPGDDVAIVYTVAFLSENEMLLSYNDSFDVFTEIELRKL